MRTQRLYWRLQILKALSGDWNIFLLHFVIFLLQKIWRNVFNPMSMKSKCARNVRAASFRPHLHLQVKWQCTEWRGHKIIEGQIHTHIADLGCVRGRAGHATVCSRSTRTLVWFVRLFGIGLTNIKDQLMFIFRWISAFVKDTSCLWIDLLELIFDLSQRTISWKTIVVLRWSSENIITS